MHICEYIMKKWHNDKCSTHSNDFGKESEFILVLDWAQQMNIQYIWDDLQEVRMSRCSEKEAICHLEKGVDKALLDTFTCTLHVSCVANEGGNPGDQAAMWRGRKGVERGWEMHSCAWECYGILVNFLHWFNHCEQHVVWSLIIFILDWSKGAILSQV